MTASDRPAGAAGFFAAPADRTILFFDGHCGLCNRVVDFLIARDLSGTLLFAPIPGETAALLLPGEVPPGGMPRSLVLWEKGRVLRKSDAALRAFAVLGGPWTWISILQVVPRRIRDVVYEGIARNRYRWFGRRGTCRMPLEKERQRFLP